MPDELLRLLRLVLLPELLLEPLRPEEPPDELFELVLLRLPLPEEELRPDVDLLPELLLPDELLLLPDDLLPPELPRPVLFVAIVIEF